MTKAQAISDYQITGIQTTLEFGAFVMEHEAFTSGHFDTHFVKKYFEPRFLKSANYKEQMIAAWYASSFFNAKKQVSIDKVSSEKSKWKQNRG